MSVVILAVSPEQSAALAADLELDGAVVIAVSGPEHAGEADLQAADAIVLNPDRRTLTAGFVRACDRAGTRIIAIAASGDADPGSSRLLARYGLSAPLPADAAAWQVLGMLAEDVPPAPQTGRAPSRLLAVWGPHGAPGRSTLAIQLAVELARAGRRSALIDADTTAPSLALLLGLGDESPGLAAACRRAELGSLDAPELDRLSTPVETSAGAVEVLGGLNRPGRWPELAAGRLRSTLEATRGWVDDSVVDVSASFDDEDDGLDPGAPSRHAATAVSLREADQIVAVLSADPLGVSRFLRGHAELRHLVGATPIRVVANRVRPGPLGIDARGQIRRTLERFAGIDEVTFLPDDQRAVDAAALHARPVGDVAPRSAFVAGIRRLATSLLPREAATADSSRGSSRVARRLR